MTNIKIGSIVYFPAGLEGNKAYGIVLNRYVDTQWNIYWFDLKERGTCFDADLKLVLP